MIGVEATLDDAGGQLDSGAPCGCFQRLEIQFVQALTVNPGF